ncbi:glutathione peroxidase [Paratissierella segnis]|jgi:glutathione peroxidase|uniref:Glutathione peroxidase n=1 Tax=Paratissierella segnis TaxID=2763679 RepID=A0A926EZ76_9FIRM|nr:glutathione peroxidase [Paratissierella segnis]MBC8588970.1 glutathione peroxidase [Paratissierella segnis]
MKFYDITVKDSKGNDVSLSEYKDKVLLIVNTATGCGFTPQYNGLQELYEKYKDKGFEILDFPCNQFGNQAPGTNEEINNFCTLHYNITFKQFDKINVNGDNESKLYSWLKSQKGGLGSSNIKWNFTKFLINRNGEVVERYGSAKTPASIESAIVKLLEE